MSEYSLFDLTLSHIYGMVNGVHLSVFVILSFYTLSLFFSEKRYGMYKSMLLTTITLLSFSLFNLFAQSSHDTITTEFIPSNVYTFSKYAVSIGLMCSVYLCANYIQLLSLSGVRLVSDFRWVVIALYATDVSVFVILFFIDDFRIANMLILLNFFPHLIAVIVFCYIALKDYRKILIALYVICLLVTIYMFHQMYHHTLEVSDIGYALFQLVFCLVILAVAFISIRYSYIGTINLSKARHIDPKRLIFDIIPSLDRGEFFLTYQPKQALKTKKVCGVEALIRWQHPKHGMIRPDEFIKIAEYSNQLDELCEFVVTECVQQAKVFYNKGLDLPISINFSVININAVIVNHLIETIKEHNLPTHLIVVEITESIMFDFTEETEFLIQVLREKGIRLSLDDYGTGFSSMSYLRDLHFYELKIDKSFVFDIETNKNSHAIVQSVIGMGKRLGMQVVAEGVENESVTDILSQDGCDVIQGYHLAKPMTIDELNVWLKTQKVTNIVDNALFEQVSDIHDAHHMRPVNL